MPTAHLGIKPNVKAQLTKALKQRDVLRHQLTITHLYVATHPAFLAFVLVRSADIPDCFQRLLAHFDEACADAGELNQAVLRLLQVVGLDAVKLCGVSLLASRATYDVLGAVDKLHDPLRVKVHVGVDEDHGLVLALNRQADTVVPCPLEQRVVGNKDRVQVDVAGLSQAYCVDESVGVPNI